jgi:hypothetical protein
MSFSLCQFQSFKLVTRQLNNVCDNQFSVQKKILLSIFRLALNCISSITIQKSRFLFRLKTQAMERQYSHLSIKISEREKQYEIEIKSISCH